MSSYAQTYHLTWTAYGSWLPGDERGWVRGDLPGVQNPEPALAEHAQRRMRYSAISFDIAQQQLILTTITSHCDLRFWRLHALHVGRNHIHTLLTCPCTPETALTQLKAWCSRRLSDSAMISQDQSNRQERRRWFSEHGSTRYVFNEDYFHTAYRYITEQQ